MSLAKFRNRASSDSFHKIRGDFRDNYTFIENYCSENYGKGDYLDWLSNKIDIIKGNEEAIKKLIKLDTVKSGNYDFNPTPTVTTATDLLRKKLLDSSISSNYAKNESRALLAIIQQVRDNLTHYGKFEIGDKQYMRNFELVSLALEITTSIIGKLEN